MDVFMELLVILSFVGAAFLAAWIYIKYLTWRLDKVEKTQVLPTVFVVAKPDYSTNEMVYVV